VDFRWSMVGINDDFTGKASSLTPDQLSTLWPSKFYEPYLKDVPVIYYPGINVNGNQFGRTTAWWQHPKSYAYYAKASRLQGPHNLKAGVDFRHQPTQAIRPELFRFFFQPGFTADTPFSPNTKLSGDGWATLLLGALDSNSYMRSIPRQKTVVNYYGAYIQDDWKVNRRLTLNLGLRWEYETPPVDPEDRISRYLDLNSPIPEFQSQSPQIPSEVKPFATISYKYNGAWIFADSANRGMFATQKYVFQPRFGLAYRINDKSVLRLGYARMVSPAIFATDQLGSLPYPGFSAISYVLPNIQGVPQANFNDPFPASKNPLILPVGKASGRYTNLGGAASWDKQDLKTATNDRITVSFQRELPLRMTAQIAWLMNMGHNLPYSLNLNMMDPALNYQYKSALGNQVANPFYLTLPAEKMPGSLRTRKTVSISELLKPYPQYSSLTQTNTDGLRNRYHGVKVLVQRSFDKGLGFQFGYNYARERTDDFFNDLDQYANRLTYRESLNPRHRITVAGTYDLPVGRGRKLLPNSPALVDAILGGWSTSSSLTWNTGSFMQFGQAVVSGDPVLGNPTLEKWFNTAAFSTAVAFTPRTNPYSYPDLTGPRYWNLDSTLVKFFKLNDRFKLEFRIEAYNMTNSVVWSNPDTSVTSSTFGRVTSQANSGRQVQYAARLHF